MAKHNRARRQKLARNRRYAERFQQLTCKHCGHASSVRGSCKLCGAEARHRRPRRPLR